ncbi:uncharacterized protein LOC100899756 [Galendromus occidentalis]|uniref:Uncharacterized protein LOC100899756 n=1 Tax=Galendromus occidentalis TaxID=34638 RepID=A0AAJ6QTS5_9ACAR|nr:uncharacterized protein LOC100899756 [Galendromus occidentalis]
MLLRTFLSTSRHAFRLQKRSAVLVPEMEVLRDPSAKLTWGLNLVMSYAAGSRVLAHPIGTRSFCSTVPGSEDPDEPGQCTRRSSKPRKKITPRTDIAFKKIFGVPENADLLMSLINSVVADEDKVVDVNIINPYNVKQFVKDKESILDIKATGENGQRFDIEIQVALRPEYEKRALYYWARLYSEQLGHGDDYSVLNKAIGIHFTNFSFVPPTGRYHHSFQITEKQNGQAFFPDLELHTIELSKFVKSASETLPNVIQRVESSLDRWATFLTKYDELDKDNLPRELDDTNIRKALHVLEVMMFTPEERDAYEARLKHLRRDASWEKFIEFNRTEARIEGKMEGKMEGSREIAKLLKENGVSIEIILRTCGMTKEEVDEL